MMMHAVLTSLDSLVAGCALAALLPRASQWLAAALLVGVADAAASLLAAPLVAPPGGLPAAAIALLALYGLYVLAATRLAGCGLLRAPAWAVLAALAVALSLDNLLAPAAGAAVAVMGAASAALMLAGLAAGARMSRGLSGRSRTAWVGAGLVAVACLAVVA